MSPECVRPYLKAQKNDDRHADVATPPPPTLTWLCKFLRLAVNVVWRETNAMTSNGLSACADTTLVLDRDSNGITLYVRGRDIDEKETAMEFTSGLWSVKGDAAKVRMTSERQAILDALEGGEEPMSPQEIADAAEISHSNARQILSRMCKAGDIQKAGRGRY